MYVEEGSHGRTSRLSMVESNVSWLSSVGSSVPLNPAVGIKMQVKFVCASLLSVNRHLVALRMVHHPIAMKELISQSNELRFVPPTSSVPTTLKPTQGAASVSVVHDTLTHGLPSTSSTINSRHPLESRIKNWDTQQDQLKLEMAKRLGGIGEVIRIATERKVVGEDFRPVALGGPSNLHLDILTGRDTRIDIDDIYNGLAMLLCWLILDTETSNMPFHLEVEKRLRM
jgi:proteasome maturation protein